MYKQVVSNSSNKQTNYTCAAESLADDNFMGIGKVSQCAPCEGYIGTAAGDHWDTCKNSLKYTLRQLQCA